MDDSLYSDNLVHYGVKGMKWGVRKAVRKDENVRRAKKRMNEDLDEAARAARRTKMFAVTKRGKQKQARRQKEYDRAFSKAEKSINAYEATKKNAIKKAKAELKKRKESPKISAATKAKDVVNFYSSHPIAAMTDFYRATAVVSTADFLAGPYVRKGASAINRQLKNQRQRYYDTHPILERD